MSTSFLETHNRAASDYPYIQSDTKNLTCRSHFHDEIELIEIVSGEIIIICDGQKLLLREGDLCVLMPGEIHSFRSEQKNRIHIMKLSCKHSLEKNDLARLRVHKPLPPSSALNQTIRSDMESIRREDKERTMGYGYAVNHWVTAILRDLLRASETTSQVTSDYKKHMMGVTLLERVNSYIEKHYTEPVTLADIALHCGFSPYYFAHLFKSVTDTTFYHYLTSYRCDQATALLSLGEKKMIEIAYACGFSDVRAFNRAFKRVYAQTPSTYRNERSRSPSELS